MSAAEVQQAVWSVPCQTAAATRRGSLVESSIGWLAPTFCHKQQLLSTQRRRAVNSAKLGLMFYHRKQQLGVQSWLRHTCCTSAAFSRSMTSRGHLKAVAFCRPV